MGPQKDQHRQRRQLILPISEENAIEYQKLDREIRRKARELLKLPTDAKRDAYAVSLRSRPPLRLIPSPRSWPNPNRFANSDRCAA